MMRSKTILIIIIGIAFALLTTLISIALVISTIPKEAYIEDGNIIMKTKFGTEYIIPELDVTYVNLPTILPSMTRINGTSIGKYHSGHFQDKQTMEKYYLFIYGSGTRRSFIYNDEIYIVDFIKY